MDHAGTFGAAADPAVLSAERKFDRDLLGKGIGGHDPFFKAETAFRVGGKGMEQFVDMHLNRFKGKRLADYAG